MDNPPEHVRNGHSFVGIRLVLVHDRPGETGDGVGGIARRVDKVEAQIGRNGGLINILGSCCRAIDGRHHVLHIGILHGSVLDAVRQHVP